VRIFNSHLLQQSTDRLKHQSILDRYINRPFDRSRKIVWNEGYSRLFEKNA